MPRNSPYNSRNLIDLRTFRPVHTYSEVYKNRLELDEIIKMFSPLNLTDTLSKLSFACARICKEEKIHDDRKVITRINLAYLSKVATYCCQNKDGIIGNDKVFDDAALIFNDHPIQRFSKGDDIKELCEHIVRSSQFMHLNDTYLYTLPRTMIIYNDLATEFKDATEIDIHKSFQELTGLSIKEHIYSGLAVLSVFLNGGIANLGNLRGQASTEVIPYLEKFINNNSISVEEFRKNYTEADILNPFALNPYQKFPLLRVDAENIICPTIPYLWDRVTRGIYHILLEKYSERFTRSLGPIFEAYVGRMLRQFYSTDQMFKEKIYTKEKVEARSTDWVVKEGHWLTMFECKIKRIRQRATKETGNLEELKKDIEDGVVAGLIQIDNVIEEIKRKNDQFKEFSDVNRFIPIILFLDEFDFANSLMMRNFINEVYQTKKGEAFRNQYHILDIEEFENLLPTIKIGSGRGLLRSLLQHKEKEQFSSFTDFFYYRFKKGVRVNHFLRERFDQTWKEAISFIFNKDIRDVELPTRKR